MATGKMYTCEVRVKYLGGRTEWREREVRLIEDGSTIRCKHCHGEVRIHRKRAENGPQDHVEHMPGVDARNCQGAGAFRATRQKHRMSVSPVG